MTAIIPAIFPKFVTCKLQKKVSPTYDNIIKIDIPVKNNNNNKYIIFSILKLK